MAQRQTAIPSCTHTVSADILHTAEVCRAQLLANLIVERAMQKHYAAQVVDLSLVSSRAASIIRKDDRVATSPRELFFLQTAYGAAARQIARDPHANVVERSTARFLKTLL